jgi:histidyl-tRNA synthetase
VENEEVFAKTLGVTSDIVLKEMYRVQGGVNSKEKLVLRPEGTAGVLNNLLSEVHSSSLTNSPQRLWYQGPMFRHERPQAGRLR